MERLRDCGKTGMDREGVEREGDRGGGCGERRVVERDRGSERVGEGRVCVCVCGRGGGVSSLSVTLSIVFPGVGAGVGVGSHLCQSLFPSYFYHPPSFFSVPLLVVARTSFLISGHYYLRSNFCVLLSRYKSQP